MKAIIIGSESSGNGYILKSDADVLLLEAGVRITEIKKALDFDLSKIRGVVVTHGHL